jgi:hypothetical protein
MSTLLSLILLGSTAGIRRREQACCRRQHRCWRVLGLSGLASLPSRTPWLSTLLALACLIDTQGPSPERRPIEPVNRGLCGGGPFTSLALRRAR